MNTLIYKILIFIFFFSSFFKGNSQSCNITPSAYKVCLGSSVVFTLNTTGIVSKTSWTFGDGASDTLLSAAHIYSNVGSYMAMVIVKFTNNTSCTAVVSQPIRVFDLPQADFTKSRDTFCLSVPLCVTNTTQLGSSGAPIRKVTFLFGDGAIVYNVNNPCHNYTKTGNFVISLEVEDTNGCISRIEKSVRVVDDLKIQLQMTLIRCGTVSFNNINAYALINVKRFYWDFGDGTFDSSNTNYYNIIHSFNNIAKCPYVVKLFIQSRYGCSDIKSVSVCPLYRFNVNLTEDKKKMCSRGNEFNFFNPPNPGAIMSWRYKEEGTATWKNVVFGNTAKYSFPLCGKYIISLDIKSGLCDTVLYDTIEVQGPQAHIELDTIAPYKVINHYMCTPDTAFFVSPTSYQSRHCSPSIKRLWDFADTHCAQCTTDTRNGINVGFNCRWSTDSFDVKHNYSDTGCYAVRLLLWDTLSGCIDSDRIEIVIGRPDLSKLKVGGINCLGALQSVDFSAVKPLCDLEEFWFVKDTLCIGYAWIKMPKQNFSYRINSTCSGDSAVSGFMIKNGNCYDTFYLVKHFPRLHPRFSLTNTKGCAPFTTSTAIFDTLQGSCTKAIWDWGDGTSTLDSPVVNGYVKKQIHTFQKNGTYAVKLALYDTLRTGGGCVFDTTLVFGVGFYFNFAYNIIVCNSQEVRFSSSVYNWSDPYDVFNPYRKWVGALQWSFGDGAIDTGIAPKHRYLKAGRYTVKLIATDTNGCVDSIEKIIKLNELHVNFTWNPKILVCGQIVQFIDSSWVKDSSDMVPQDSISSWIWDFGDLRAPSTLKNPAHAYFVNGDFFVKLKVKTWKGCEDSVIIKISIAGPIPMFQLLTDSVGCAPYTIMLRNSSAACDRNIIYMGDAGNTNFVLKENDTLSFTYQNPGVYSIYIFGEASFVNPNTGSNVYCSAWYPDKTNPKAKLIRIVVLAKPPVKFLMPDTICVNTTFDITNISDKRYDFYSWDYGDSTIELRLRPDTNASYSYKKIGTYWVTLKPNYQPLVNQKECPDTFTKKIVVVDLTSGFTMDTTMAPLIKFNNSSIGAHTYLWDFGHPQSGAKNRSNEFNTQHDFLNDTGVFNICLTSYNAYGCEDSVCLPYRNTNYRLLIIPNVFTINNDGVNDVFDIDIHGEIGYHLSIYNRWGALVFNTDVDGLDNDGNNWNGNVKNSGAALPPGEYYFKFEYQFRGEEVKTQKGIITLIR